MNRSLSRVRAPYLAVALALVTVVVSSTTVFDSASQADFDGSQPEASDLEVPLATGSPTAESATAEPRTSLPVALGFPDGAESVTRFSPGACDIVTYTPPTAAQPFSAEICRPDGDQRDTMIVLVHGGGGVGGVPSDFDQWRDSYLDIGYPTMSISYRILDPEVDRGIFPQPEANMKAAVQYARLHADELAIDPDRIVAHGASAGARLAGIAFATPDDPGFGTAERWPNVSDEINGFIGYYGYYSGWNFEPQAYFVDGIDPLANVAASVGPVDGSALLVHGDADWLVPVDFSRTFAAALSANGTDLTYVEPAGENHTFDGYDTDSLTPSGLIELARVRLWLTARFS